MIPAKSLPLLSAALLVLEVSMVCAASQPGTEAEPETQFVPPAAEALPPATEAVPPAAEAVPPATEAIPVDAAPVPEKVGLYLHVGGGAGLAFMSSDPITDLFGDEFAIGLGMHFSMSGSIGYRNLIQAEVRRGDSSHTLRNNNIITNESTEIPMDYDFTEYVGKVNLLYLLSGGRQTEVALFIVAGTSSIEYRDEVGDGFEGDGTVYGFEFTRLSPSRSAAVTMGLRRYGIEFDEITLFGQTGRFPVDASNWVLHTAFTFGLGL